MSELEQMVGEFYHIITLFITILSFLLDAPMTHIICFAHSTHKLKKYTSLSNHTNLSFGCNLNDLKTTIRARARARARAKEELLLLLQLEGTHKLML